MPESPLRDGEILVVVTLSGAGEFSFHVRSDWRSIAEPRDLEYLESLCRDFKVRAYLAPETLFEQLSSMAVGPLDTCGPVRPWQMIHCSGACLAALPSSSDLYQPVSLNEDKRRRTRSALDRDR